LSGPTATGILDWRPTPMLCGGRLISPTTTTGVPFGRVVGVAVWASAVAASPIVSSIINGTVRFIEYLLKLHSRCEVLAALACAVRFAPSYHSLNRVLPTSPGD